jgi:hypothetical protein
MVILARRNNAQREEDGPAGLGCSRSPRDVTPGPVRRGLESQTPYFPRPLICKIRLVCRMPSLTWLTAASTSAGIGPRRILLWSGLVVSVHCVSAAIRGNDSMCPGPHT